VEDSEYKQLQESLKGAPTPEARAAAAAAMRKYLASQNVKRASLQTKRKGSTPTLVSLGLGKGYPSAIPLNKLPDEIEKNPELYKLMQKLVLPKK